MTELKAMIITAAGAVGSWVSSLYGGWTEDLTTLMILMGIDFVMGLLIAGIWKKSDKSASGKINSFSAWKGLCRKGVSLLVVLVAYRLDITLGVNYIKTAVIIAFVANEGISIIENLGIMGVPLPKVLTKAIEVLQNKLGQEDKENE